MEGFVDIIPVIRKITFHQKGKFEIHLGDGRIVSVPLSAFPAIRKLNSAQRKKWYVLDDTGFSFDDCNEVYHIEQVLGRYENYKYNLT